MPDPAERYNKLVAEEERRLRRNAKDGEAMLPTYSRQALTLSREEQHADYLTIKNAPEGYQGQFEEWKQQFGQVRAAKMFVQWVLENE